MGAYDDDYRDIMERDDAIAINGYLATSGHGSFDGYYLVDADRQIKINQKADQDRRERQMAWFYGHRTKY